MSCSSVTMAGLWVCGPGGVLRAGWKGSLGLLVQQIHGLATDQRGAEQALLWLPSHLGGVKPGHWLSQCRLVTLWPPLPPPASS